MTDKARELLEWVVDVWGDDEEVIYANQDREALMNEIRAYLAEPEPTQDEPVAWLSHNGFRFNADIEPIEHGIEVPLYLHPAPRQEFVRLSEEEIQEAFPHVDQFDDKHVWAAIRWAIIFAERHHGISGGGDE